MTGLHNLPEGFQNKPGEHGPLFKAETQSVSKNAAPTVSFRMRPGGGGPGRGLGQSAEHAENVKGTLTRMLQYFQKESKLLMLLMASVICVTLAGLLAPSLQGKAIDAIKDKTWETLYSCVVALLAVYAVNVLSTLGQSLMAARLSQNIVKKMRHDLFKKID